MPYLILLSRQCEVIFGSSGYLYSYQKCMYGVGRGVGWWKMNILHKLATEYLNHSRVWVSVRQIKLAFWIMKYFAVLKNVSTAEILFLGCSVITRERERRIERKVVHYRWNLQTGAGNSQFCITHSFASEFPGQVTLEH